MRYTDEELSCILGEHEAGTLMRGGAAAWIGMMALDQEYPRCCANQAAYNEPDNAHALQINQFPGHWFDNEYTRYMTPEELLEGLEGAVQLDAALSADGYSP